MSASNGSANGSAAIEAAEEKEVQDIDLEMCSVNEKIIALVIEEDNLRDMKAEVAKEYRDKINEAKAKRREHEKRRAELQKAQLEVLGDVILENNKLSS